MQKIIITWLEKNDEQGLGKEQQLRRNKVKDGLNQKLEKNKDVKF